MIEESRESLFPELGFLPGLTTAFCDETLKPPDSFQAYRLLQRQVLRGSADHEAVLSGDELPAILLHVEDGKVFRLDLDRDLFALSRLELYFAPANQSLGRFRCAHGQGSVNLCHLSARAFARVLHRETHAGSLSGLHFQTRVGI